jgi:hypothetical protein
LPLIVQNNPKPKLGGCLPSSKSFGAFNWPITILLKLLGLPNAEVFILNILTYQYFPTSIGLKTTSLGKGYGTNEVL